MDTNTFPLNALNSKEDHQIIGDVTVGVNQLIEHMKKMKNLCDERTNVKAGKDYEITEYDGNEALNKIIPATLSRLCQYRQKEGKFSTVKKLIVSVEIGRGHSEFPETTNPKEIWKLNWNCMSSIDDMWINNDMEKRNEGMGNVRFM